MQDVIRNGIISSVNSQNGTARVYYPERGSTTADFPLFAFWGEYKMPEIGEQVVVLHLSNDTSSGVILGKFWDDKNKPPEGLTYKRVMGDGAFEQFSGEQVLLRGPEIRFEHSGGSITLSELLALRGRVEALERRL